MGSGEALTMGEYDSTEAESQAARDHQGIICNNCLITYIMYDVGILLYQLIKMTFFLQYLNHNVRRPNDPIFALLARSHNQRPFSQLLYHQGRNLLARTPQDSHTTVHQYSNRRRIACHLMWDRPRNNIHVLLPRQRSNSPHSYLMSMGQKRCDQFRRFVLHLLNKSVILLSSTFVFLLL